MSDYSYTDPNSSGYYDPVDEDDLDYDDSKPVVSIKVTSAMDPTVVKADIAQQINSCYRKEWIEQVGTLGHLHGVKPFPVEMPWSAAEAATCLNALLQDFQQEPVSGELTKERLQKLQKRWDDISKALRLDEH